jgi:hypothetical protein
MRRRRLFFVFCVLHLALTMQVGAAAHAQPDDPSVEDYVRAEAHYQAVRAAAGEDIPRHVSQRHSAILGLAGVRRNQWRIADAIALLDEPIASRPATPQWVMPSLLLRRANYKMLLNDASAADDGEASARRFEARNMA